MSRARRRRRRADAARDIFERLGAAADIAAIDKIAPPANDRAAPKGKSASAHRLTARELEVLRLVAAGKTNQVIAKDGVGRDAARIAGVIAKQCARASTVDLGARALAV